MNPFQKARQSFVNRPSASYFGGARTGRLFEDFYPSIISADGAIKADIRLMRARARTLVQDTGPLAGWARAQEDNIAGAEGMRLQARCKYPRSGYMERENDATEEAFRQWGMPENCSANRRLSFTDTQRLAIRTARVEGESFTRRLFGFDNPFGYAIQIIDADLLDEQFNVRAANGVNEIRMGVEIDRWGAAVAYHFWDKHPTESGFDRRSRTRIPSGEIVHLFRSLRPGQTRGITELASIMIAMKMLDGYTEAEITQARIAASAGGFFQWLGTENIEAYPVPKDDNAAPGTDPARFNMDLEPGLAQVAPPGAQFQAIEPTHPNGNFPDFSSAIKHDVATGSGVSYATLTGDMSQQTFSSARMAQFPERYHFRALQVWFVTQFHRLIYLDFLRMASLTGMVTLAHPGDLVRSSVCEWECRGWPYINPLEDIQTFEAELAAGVNSRQEFCAERGRDWRKIMADQKEEQDHAAALGLDVNGLKRSTMTPTGEAGAPPPEKNGNGKEKNGAEKNRVALHLGSL